MTQLHSTLMEAIQGGPINPCFYEEEGHVGFLECMFEQRMAANEDEEDEEEGDEADNMPFLQMLQANAEEYSSSSSPLLMLNNIPLINNPSSCSFQTMLRLQQQQQQQQQQHNHHHLNNNNYIQQPTTNLSDKQQEEKLMSSTNCTTTATNNNNNKENGAVRRKRKRTRPSKNKEEVESQRMTHIAVERNRRKQMNDHLNVLRSLMPSSYIQRGDQASIIGGAIDFVNELEQLLQSLEAQKRARKGDVISISVNGENSATSSSSSSSSSASAMASTVMTSLSPSSSYRLIHGEDRQGGGRRKGGEGQGGSFITAENKSEAADVEVTVIHSHVNLKIQCPRRPGQLLKAIVALQDLSLSVLHLNITTSQSLVLFSFNLKIEDECELGSANEIAAAVHQIFSYINSSSC